MKLCKACGLEKPESEFYRRSKGEPDLRAACKDCHNPNKFKVCRVCGCQWVAKSGEGSRKLNRCDNCYLYYRRSENLFYAALTRAKKKNLEFSITREWIENKIKGCCERTGIKFDLTKNSKSYLNRKPFCPSLDKIDSQKGYTPDNVQVVCWIYNVSKQQFTDEEVFEFCQKVVDFSTTKNAKNVEAQTP